MKIDCQWIENKLEAFFCEQLTAEEARQFSNHLESCAECRRKVAELKSIDPLIRRFFQHELAVARAPRRVRWSALAGVTATAVAAVFAFVILLHRPQPVPPVPLVSQAPSPGLVATSTPAEAPSPSTPKSGSSGPQDRAKPQPGEPDNLLKPGSAPTPEAASADKNASVPDFVVTDPAGYARTLHDYRGYTLIFGVWNGRQPHTVSTMQKIYETFGPNTKLRIVGVALRRQQKPTSASFPIAFNQRSNLLGVKEGQFAVVSGDGTVAFRGSLLDDPNSVVAAIRSALAKLN